MIEIRRYEEKDKKEAMAIWNAVVGRCGHICNTSYAVKEGKRGLHIGEQLVKHSLKTGTSLGFRILQFNAVVATNIHALHLYE